MKYESLLDLTQLPYFYQKDNKLYLNSKDIGPIIDFHTHIAWKYGLAKVPDQDKKSLVNHFFPESGIPFDLSHYSAYDFTPKALKKCQKETVKAIVSTKGYTGTHTASNLIEEMSRMGVKKAVVLAIDVGFSRNSIRVLQQATMHDELIPFASIDPKIPTKKKRLNKFLNLGCKGLKIHPPIQMCHPNGRFTKKLVSEAQTYDLPILFHCGYSPLMPKWEKVYSKIEEFEEVITENTLAPIIIGHAGIDSWKEVIKIANKNPHVYIEISGQPPEVIKSMVSEVGEDRILFGSDWPYYPIAISLAKTLLATEGNEEMRNKILYKNAAMLLGV